MLATRFGWKRLQAAQGKSQDEQPAKDKPAAASPANEKRPDKRVRKSAQ